jgi:monofunctional glycosyltransferase
MSELQAEEKAGAAKSWLLGVVRWVLLVAVGCWVTAALVLVSLRWIDPPTTAVQMERRVQSWARRAPYHKEYEFVPLGEISPDLQHAVIAAEDARFYDHHGFDWHQIEIAAEQDAQGGRFRGASTITQQLVKNIFFGTGRSVIRKAAEFTLVPVAEVVLGKRRLLELYLNEIEWGRGIYGAEAACNYYYRVSARRIDRDESTRLAAILPAPLTRRPDRMNRYSVLILVRMRQMGW